MFNVAIILPFIIMPIIFIILVVASIITASKKHKNIFNNVEDMMGDTQENLFEHIKNTLNRETKGKNNSSSCEYCGTVFEGHKCPNCGANKTEK